MLFAGCLNRRKKRTCENSLLWPLLIIALLALAQFAPSLLFGG
jgi:hypothetical protein